MEKGKEESMEQGKRNRNKTWQRKESNGREFGEKMMEKGKESAKENRRTGIRRERDR